MAISSCIFGFSGLRPAWCDVFFRRVSRVNVLRVGHVGVGEASKQGLRFSVPGCSEDRLVGLSDPEGPMGFDLDPSVVKLVPSPHCHCGCHDGPSNLAFSSIGCLLFSWDLPPSPPPLNSSPLSPYAPSFTGRSG